MVSICTTCLTFKTLYLPIQYICVFHIVPIINAHYFPIQRKWLCFLTKTSCVPCEVRSQFLCIHDMKFTSEGRIMDNAASCRPFTAKVRFRSRSVRMRFMVGESGAEAGFFSSKFRRPLSLSFCAPIFHSHLIIIRVLPEGQSGIAWQSSNKAVFCRLSGSKGQSSILSLFLNLQTVNSDVSALRVARNGIDFEYG